MLLKKVKNIDQDYSLSVSIICLVLGYAWFDQDFVLALIIALQTYTVLRFIYKLGRSVPFMEFLGFYSILDTLLMPLAGYRIYNQQNALAALWGKYMRVPEDTYFNYMLPANIIFLLGIYSYSRFNNQENTKRLFESMKRHLRDKGDIGIFFVVLGYAAKLAIPYAPGGFSHVIGLISWLRLVGPVYIYYSNHKFRKAFFAISIIAYLVETAQHGMFGETGMYLGLLGLIIFINFRMNFLTKIAVFSALLFFVLSLQSIKGTYRDITWKGEEREGLSLSSGSSTSTIFSSLLLDRFRNPAKIFQPSAMFATFVRMNQGFLISLAMEHVPSKEPYAYGSTLIRTVGGVLLPRFLWPNKPESGGVENMRRFMGIKGRITFSMNIGPYGEAYGNFGPFWGLSIVYLYGFLLALMLRFCLKTAHAHPSFLAWFPVLFFYSLTVETDILTTLNSLFKSGIFIFILYKILPVLLKRPI